MQHGYVEVVDGKLYYEMDGDGTPLVLSHAGFIDSGMWDDQWSSFAARHQVIRYDMRGYGRSSPLEATIARRDDLLALLKHLDIAQAHMLGCSMGGEIVLDFGLEHPQRVLSLVLVSTAPGGFAMQGPPPATLLEMLGAMEQGDLTLASELQIRMWVDGPFRQPEEVDAAVRQHAAAMNQIPMQNFTLAIDNMEPFKPLDPPAANRLSEIRVPTLIIAGALDHPEILRAAGVMAAEIAGTEKAIMVECAHVPNMERPAEFNRLVLDFLARAR